MEAKVIAAFAAEGVKVKRAHELRPEVGHGFIDSQKYGMEVFSRIPADAPVVVAEAVWQYSHHVLHGLVGRKAPVLTVANWSGTWPGLVGMLNLNGSLTKAGQPYSTLWSEDFTDSTFVKGLRKWIATGKVKHDTSHATALSKHTPPARAVKAGGSLAAELRKSKAIMGVFDEGCMGMYNAIVPDELLHPTGVFKERLSQSSLYAKMLTVSEAEARGVFDWLRKKGVRFELGTDEATELTEAQLLGQCRMYIAAVRLADEFGCSTIGIQYQQGLKDLAPASDLVEGLLNNCDRPPVRHETSGKVLFDGEALPHFNEVDECAGLDGLVTYRLWRKLGMPPENTLHDLRWGRHYRGPGTWSNGRARELDHYVWVLLISGAAPPEHFVGGYAGTSSLRQPAMYFRLGGGTCRGISKPGVVVWSRVYVEGGRLKYDIGLADAVGLPQAETDDRWANTTVQWPIMHTVLRGVTRDQMMAKHKSNHIQVVYAPTEAQARLGLYAKAAAMAELGLDVSICGEV
jgi:L-fucose isomerase-like protein